MYQDKWFPIQQDGITAAREMPKDANGRNPEKTFPVRVNLFRMSWTNSIHQYEYDLPDPQTSAADERKLLERGWADMKKHLVHFVIWLPGRIFSPTKVEKFPLKVCDVNGKLVQLDVCHVAEISAQKIQEGQMGPASVVGQYIADQLGGQRRIQRVGKRFYKNDCQQVKGHHRVISAFCVNLPRLGSAGPLLQLDVLHKPASAKNIVEVMKGAMEGTDIFQPFPEIRAEWLRFCVSSTVVTNYNFRVYRIKQVHFDMNPSSTFTYHLRGGSDGEKFVEITFAKYLETFYEKSVTFKGQPLLEAYPEKAKEQVFLLPEFCCPTGVTDEMRQEKSPLSEVLKQIKVSPQERHNVIVRHGTEMENELPEALKAWGCQLGPPTETLEVEAKQLETLQVGFNEKKIYAIEEGSFARSLRNGVQCPVTIDHWLLFYPQTDEPVLEIWLRSLRDVARVAFGCKLEEPTRVCCSDQHGELQSKIIDNITPSTQLMMLLIPNKDVRKVYHSFKYLACEQYPCISQVVRSDTIRKRQSIGSILHKVVQQINAKFCGPLWQIIPKDSEDPAFVDFKKRPFMIFGIDVYLTFEGVRWLGISATLDKVFSQYYSMAAELEKGSVQRWRTSLSVELQRIFRDALNAFTDCNDGILPETIVVYRASVNQEEWPLVDAIEMQALLQVVTAAAKLQKGYSPKVVVIGIARKTDMRIFKGDKENIRNPEPGTVVDDPVVCPGPTPEFFLLSQAIAKGSAVPTHYTVLINQAELSLQLIENLTNRLCLMYYNVPNAVRVPAPVLYATKIAAFCGNVIKKPPRPRLQRTLFFL